MRATGTTAAVAAPAATARIRLFLVDDHDVVREGLMALLGREPDLEIAGEAADAERAIEGIERTQPDVVILDYRLPGMDGLALCREIAERRVGCRVVMLSAFVDDEVVQSAYLAGAYAYVVKDVEAGELKRAIRAAARNRTSWVTGVVGRATGPQPAGLGGGDGLTGSEMQVLRLLVEGRSNARISAILGMSPHTVKIYLGQVYAKLGVRNRSEAVAVALRRRLV